MPPRTTTASRNVVTDRYPIEMPPMSKEPVPNEPRPASGVSAENVCSRRFWMTMESPKVTSSVASGPDDRLFCSSTRWVR